MTHQPRASFQSPRFAQPATFMRLPHVDTWDEYFGRKYFHGTPFRRAIEEGIIDGRRFIQVGIRGPMYGEEDFDFHREHGITVIDIDQVKARGIAWAVTEIRRVLTG